MSECLIEKILVATDGSEPSLDAARYAAEIAACVGAYAVVLNAAEVSVVTQFVRSAVATNEASEPDPRETGLEVADKTKEIFNELGIPAHTKIIEGPAADVIIREAQDGDYDLIVMGSRGVGMGVHPRVSSGLGSVAEQVLGSAPCPVLLARE